MSDDLITTVNGHPALSARVSVPNVGPWFAEIELAEKVTLSGRVTIQIGPTTLLGSALPSATGTYNEATRATVIGGGGGWGNPVARKSYHNDAGVKSLTVATDVARDVGERLGAFVPSADRVGVDYVRRASPASEALSNLLGEVPWWVDYDGLTRAGARPATPAGDHELLEFDPRTQRATIGLNDLTAVGIGSVLSGRLDAPVTVREMEIRVAAGALRLVVWCGDDGATLARLPRLLTSIVERVVGARLLGKYRYRVVSMAGDGRANLQAVRAAAGLPDVLPVSMWPGVAGAHAELAPGAEVLLEFIEGDPTLPIVVGFGGKGQPGFVPTVLSFANGVAPVARVGDTVQVFFPPSMPVTGTVSGNPFVGVITVASPGLGTIQTGNPKVLA